MADRSNVPGAPKPKSWWVTLPGLLTAVAGLVTAIGVLVGTLAAAGVIGGAAKTTDAPEPTTIERPEKTRTTENPVGYLAIVRSGETFQVTFFGSEACEDEGEFGAIQRGETYDLTWNGSGEGFVAHGRARISRVVRDTRRAVSGASPTLRTLTSV